MKRQKKYPEHWKNGREHNIYTYNFITKFQWDSLRTEDPKKLCATWEFVKFLFSPEARATVESEIESMLNGKEDVDTAVQKMSDSINKAITDYNTVNN